MPNRSNSPVVLSAPGHVSFAPEARVVGGGGLRGSGEGFTGAPSRAVWAIYDYGDAHKTFGEGKRMREAGFTTCLWLYFETGGGASGDEPGWEKFGGASTSRFWPSNSPAEYTWVPDRNSRGEWDYDAYDKDEEKMLTTAGRYLLPAPNADGSQQSPLPSLLKSCDAALLMDAMIRAGFPEAVVNQAMALNHGDVEIFAGGAQGAAFPYSASWGRIAKRLLREQSGLKERKAQTGSEKAKAEGADEKDMLVPLHVDMGAVGATATASGGTATTKPAGTASAAPTATAAATPAPVAAKGPFDPNDPAAVETIKERIFASLAGKPGATFGLPKLAVEIGGLYYQPGQAAIQWVNGQKGANLATITDQVWESPDGEVKVGSVVVENGSAKIVWQE